MAGVGQRAGADVGAAEVTGGATGRALLQRASFSSKPASAPPPADPTELGASRGAAVAPSAFERTDTVCGCRCSAQSSRRTRYRARPRADRTYDSSGPTTRVCKSLVREPDAGDPPVRFDEGILLNPTLRCDFVIPCSAAQGICLEAIERQKTSRSNM
jgi:hypothetical protein